jgi:membrane fusion protein (multidrug efflux system)
MKRIILAATLFALVHQTACTSSAEEKSVHSEENTQYIVTNPLQADTSFTKEYVSQIKSVRNIEIRAQEKGYLQNIYVDEGQFVKAGQLLFKIMPKVYEAELQRSEAEARQAEIELNNAKTLADKNIVSKNEQEMAQAKLDQSKAEIALAKIHLSFTDIRAPFDGFIDRIPKKLGSLIDEGELLTSLSDNSQMFAYFNVSEPEYLDYKTNITNRGDSKVTLLLANGQPLTYKGEVETIESEFDNETGNIAFRAKFPNPDKLLRNGETGKVRMTVPVRDALIIPQKATYEIQDKKYVFVVDKNNVVRSREITVRGELPDIYVIESGLSAGDKILLEGVQKVKDNDTIKYTYEKPEDIMSHLRLKSE